MVMVATIMVGSARLLPCNKGWGVYTQGDTSRVIGLHDCYLAAGGGAYVSRVTSALSRDPPCQCAFASSSLASSDATAASDSSWYARLASLSASSPRATAASSVAVQATPTRACCCRLRRMGAACETASISQLKDARL